jgi:hypothetical protein
MARLVYIEICNLFQVEQKSLGRFIKRTNCLGRSQTFYLASLSPIETLYSELFKVAANWVKLFCGTMMADNLVKPV